MSKFLKEIRVKQLDTKCADYPDILSIDIAEEATSYNTSDVFYEYDVSVRIGNRFYARNADEVSYHKENVIRQISDFVYGDIKDAMLKWFYKNNISMRVNKEAQIEFFNIIEAMKSYDD